MKKGLFYLALLLSATTWTATARRHTLYEVNESIILSLHTDSSIDTLDLSGATDTIIPPYLFNHWYSLKAVILPDSITEIREGAFYASGIEEIYIPAGVKRLGTGMGHNVYFDEENKLSGVGDTDNIPRGVFEKCSNLRKVIFASDSKLEEKGLKAFSRCVNLNTIQVEGTESSINFPESLKKIQSMAFFHCRKLVGSLELPNGLISLGDEWMAIDTFYRQEQGADEWERLHSGTAGAFSGCTGLIGNLTIPNGVTFIPNGVFANCSGLNGVLTLPTPPDGKSLVIGASAFDGDSLLRAPAGKLDLTHVTHIGMGAFRNCANLAGTLILNPTLTEIGQAAFSGCRSLTGALELPAALVHIGQPIGNTGTADGFRTITGLYMRTVWGAYDFSRYYTLADGTAEGAFQGTGFTSVYFNETNEATPQYHFLYEGTFAKCPNLLPIPFPHNQYIHYLGKDADLYYTGLPHTLYVNPANNNDITDGRTWETAFRSLETAIDSLKANITNGWEPVIYIAETEDAIRLDATITLDFDTLYIHGGFNDDDQKYYNLAPSGNAPLIRTDGLFPAFRLAGAKQHTVLYLENIVIRDFEADDSFTLDTLERESNGVVKFINAHFRCDTANLFGNITFNETLALVNTADPLRIPHLIHTGGTLTLERVTLELAGTLQIQADTLAISKKLSFQYHPWTPLNSLPLLSAKGHKDYGDSPADITLVSGYYEDPYASFEWKDDSIFTVTTQPKLTELIINPNIPTLSPGGKTLQLSLDCEFPAIFDYTDVEWVSSMPLVADVDSNGLLTTGDDSGILTVTATVRHPFLLDGTNVLDRAEITVYVVKAVPDPHHETLDLDTEESLSVTLFPSYIPDVSLDWKSSNPAIAAVDEYGHVQTFGRSGDVVITASVRGHATDSVTFPIHVSRFVKSISLTSSALGQVPLTGAIDISIAFSPEDAARKEVAWSIDNPYIAEFISQAATSCRIRTISAGSTVLHVKTVDGSNLELFYAIEVVKGGTALSAVASNLASIHYGDGTLHIQGLDAHRAQILSAAGVVKADFRIRSDRFEQSLNLPAGIYLFRTTGAVSLTHKFVVK
jgi:hypothetical protein